MRSNCLSPKRAINDCCLSRTTASPNDKPEPKSITSPRFKRAPTLFATKSVEKPKILKRAFSEILPTSNTPKV